ncbi:MAG: alpha/beta fold hydrolase [Rhodospirillaceae bacterium]|nr:alpha/beta fold hydrolase [Rhodospirillaceae bacterium]
MVSADRESLEINDDTYRWVAKSIETIKDRLGLKIRVHHTDDLFNRGDIFLFNHFARFETIIPPYIIYQKTGAHCRSVADKVFFEGGDMFANFIRSIGVVPNDLPGLLPFLAAEILRGRKVVMFPEGGMVKDRRVMDSKGNYSVYSRTASERRKHHRGAAVLAHTLDIFKLRILDLNKNNDTDRINRWVEALELNSAEELVALAKKPTLIIPSTITFYPIRIRENFFSKFASFFTKNMSRKFSEEILIESNLVFKDTDMDIRLCEPVITRKKWWWWEKIILKRYFLKIRSLDDLFGLKDQASGYAEKILERCISKETSIIRDEYMQAMYTNITINLSHIASHLIVTLLERDSVEIEFNKFNLALYMSVKNLQATYGLQLHHSLLWPNSYIKLLDGKCPELDRFIDTCKQAKLIELSNNKYIFNDKLLNEYEFDEIRIENPVMVYENEVEPLAEVHQTVDAALDNVETVSDEDISSYMFDDELRSYQWNLEHFNSPEFDEINKKETASEDAKPYLLLPKTKCKTGVLLLHGLLATPAELREFGDGLCKQGCAVMGVRIAGHGTSPHDLAGLSWNDWLASVTRGHKILSAFCERIIVIGFSAGATLALAFAAGNPENLAGVAAVSPAIKLKDKKSALIPFVQGINKITKWIPNTEGLLEFINNDPEHPEINYRSTPVGAIGGLLGLSEHTLKELGQISTPVSIIQGDNDPVVDPDGAKLVFDGLSVADKSLHWIASDKHGILIDDVGDTHELLASFIRRMEGN